MKIDLIRSAALGVLLATPALAGGGTIAGKVEATPAKYLPETVVYLKNAAPPASPSTHSMDQKGMKFMPAVLAISAGDTVDFLNHDGVDHNVYSPDGEAYNLGMVKNGATASHRFTKAGAYTQLCSVHPEMLGYVFVAPSAFHAVVDAKGAFRIDQVPPGTYTLAVWSSHLKAADQTVTVSEGKTAQASFSLKR